MAAMTKIAFCLACFLAASAAPAAEPRVVIDVLAGPVPAGCEQADGDEIVVCAERGETDRYRIDPALMAVSRTLEKPADRRKPGYQTVGTEQCKPHGIELCPGQDTIPVTAIALKTIQVAALAAKGEDWREALRTRPDEYRLYRQAKAKQGSGKRVSVDLTVRPVADPRPGQ